MLEVAGLKPMADYPNDGENLLPMLTSGKDLNRDAVFFHYPNFAFHKDNRLGSAIRMGDFKLLEFFDDSSVELYNLSHDIGEKKNLADNRPILAAEMRDRLHKWRMDSDAQLPQPR